MRLLTFISSIALLVPQDTGREIKRLSSFLGLSTSEEEKEKIRRDVQFDVMKANRMTNLTLETSLDFSVSQFLRKGMLRQLAV